MQSGDSSNQHFGFKSDTTRRAFDSLVDSFIEDYMVKKYVAEKAGWRTIAEIAQKAHLSPSVLYGKHSTIGPVFDEPIRRGLVESRIFPGERGRGGEVMRLRIAYDKEPIKEFVNRKVRLGPGALVSTQQLVVLGTSTKKKFEGESGQELEEGELRRLVAIMFTDIVGFAALAQADEAQSIGVLERHNRLLRPMFPRFRGKEVKTVGDSFLVEFDSALDAVNCGIEIQKFLHDYNISTTENWKIKLRIGIHLGDVIRKREDIFGDAVNIASRIEPLAEPEGICVSQQVFDQIHNKTSYPIRELEKSELKNVKFSTNAYAVLMPWEKGATRSHLLAEQLKTKPEMNRLRIAVLPFASMSPDPNDEYFADGMTEELISTISKVSGLQVIARTSVLRYKSGNKSIDEIGREPDVGTVLEGSVRKSGDKLRIAAQLIDSHDNKHLWSETYDKELKDVFAIQSEISETVADALKVRLLANEKASIEKRPTSNTEAYALCLKGIYYNVNASTEGDLRRSLRYFEKAIELDPNFALAYSWLSDCYSTLVLAGNLAPREAIPKAEEAVRKALKIDPDLADAHRVFGFLLIMSDKSNWVEAEQETKRALELNPSVSGGHESYAWILAYLGRLDEALWEAREALELDPFSPTTYRTMAEVLFFSRRYDEAIEQLKKMHALNPEDRGLAYGLGLCYLQKGQFEKAIEEFDKTLDPSKGKADLALYYLALVYSRSGRTEEARRILNDFREVSSRNQFIPAFMMAQIHLALGEGDEAIKLLNKAEKEGENASLLDLKVSPFWDDLRSDPRFISLLMRIGLEN